MSITLPTDQFAARLRAATSLEELQELRRDLLDRLHGASSGDLGSLLSLLTVADARMADALADARAEEVDDALVELVAAAEAWQRSRAATARALDSLRGALIAWNEIPAALRSSPAWSDRLQHLPDPGEPLSMIVAMATGELPWRPELPQPSGGDGPADPASHSAFVASTGPGLGLALPPGARGGLPPVGATPPPHSSISA